MSVYAVGRIVAMLISLVLLPVFTHELPATDFGVIGILWLIIPLLSRAINLGLDVAVSLKYFKLNRPQLALHVYNVLFATATCGLVVLLFGWWHLDWVQTILHPSITYQVFGLLIMAVVFSIYTTMMQSFLQLSNKPVHNVVVTILPPLVTVAVTYLLITHVSRSYVSYIVGLAVSYGLFGSVALAYFLTFYHVSGFRPSSAILRQLLRIGLPVIPGAVGAIVLASGDRYMIKHFLGLEAVAIYTYGYRFAEYLSISLYEPFQKALAPIIYERAAKDLNAAAEYSARIVKYSLAFIPLVLALLILPSKDVMAWLGSGAYDESYPIFLIAVFGIFLYGTVQINSILLNHLERTELNMVTALLGAALNVGLNVLLIPRFGILAAAFTTIASYLFMLVLTIAFLGYLVPQSVPLWRVLVRLLPFLLYLIGVFAIDILAAKSGWLAYSWRFLVLLAMGVVTWVSAIELRRGVMPILRRLRPAASSARDR